MRLHPRIAPCEASLGFSSNLQSFHTSSAPLQERGELLFETEMDVTMDDLRGDDEGDEEEDELEFDDDDDDGNDGVENEAELQETEDYDPTFTTGGVAWCAERAGVCCLSVAALQEAASPALQVKASVSVDTSVRHAAPERSAAARSLQGREGAGDREEGAPNSNGSPHALIPNRIHCRPTAAAAAASATHHHHHHNHHSPHSISDTLPYRTLPTESGPQRPQIQVRSRNVFFPGLRRHRPHRRSTRPVVGRVREPRYGRSPIIQRGLQRRAGGCAWVGGVGRGG